MSPCSTVRYSKFATLVITVKVEVPSVELGGPVCPDVSDVLLSGCWTVLPEVSTI